jgi:RNA polymerase sigma factor (sigma-70 family)
VEQVRGGHDPAFEELYRRYRPRIAAFVRGHLHDDARSEDVTQEAFLSALRRIRATDAKIAFKPWIYEIARNAAIDSYRRTSRAQEVSIDGDDLLRPSDRTRLVGAWAPDSALLVKERLEHLRSAFDELPESHHRVLIMRELEGLSYREIGERLDLSRPAVESVIFRARRRLEREYEELDTGRRCHAMRKLIARLAEQAGSAADERRLARHSRRCTACRRRARELGVDPLAGRVPVTARAAALLPLPAFLRRRGSAGAQASGSSGHGAPPLVDVLGPGSSQLGFALSERAAALVTAAALAGAGGALLAGGPVSIDRGATGAPPAAKDRQAPAEVQRREPRGLRFERPKGARGAVGRDAAPRLRSAGARRATPAAPAPTARKQSTGPSSDAPPANLDELSGGLTLDDEPTGPPPKLDLGVDPGQAAWAGVPSGRSDPQPVGSLPGGLAAPAVASATDAAVPPGARG